MVLKSSAAADEGGCTRPAVARATEEAARSASRFDTSEWLQQATALPRMRAEAVTRHEMECWGLGVSVPGAFMERAQCDELRFLFRWPFVVLP